ncbi:uncharacterized protein PAC_14331 [Phialocephala subalpina]|uniref:SRR1-like domain-containing protein n=1 Tax=Phialocephala subalpina TaxID=576137 RepID=A0A1L7XHA6_9HELO|nr:uncharacterized protein PAC_14331 [Phialocephala subalpina]
MCFRSVLYPFLDTISPTDTLPDPHANQSLSKAEKDVLTAKRTWLQSDAPRKLAAIVAQIIEDRAAHPVFNIVCLGIGRNRPNDLEQIVAFSQMAAQLAIVNPEVLDNIVIQDPEMEPEMKIMFENHKCRVVEDLAAFQLVGTSTFIFAPFVPLHVTIGGVRNQPIKSLPMFIGSDLRIIIGGSETNNNRAIMDVDRPLFEQIVKSMLGDDVCSYADFPGAPPEGMRANVLVISRNYRAWVSGGGLLGLRFN